MEAVLFSIIFSVILGVIFFILFSVVGGIFSIFWSFDKKRKGKANKIDVILATLYVYSLIAFWWVMSWHNDQYYAEIYTETDCYTPFSGRHFLTLNTYFLLFNIAAFVIWIKGTKLPPLLLVVLLAILVIGLGVNTAVILQLSKHDYDTMYSLLFAPVMVLIIGVYLIIKVIRQKSEEAADMNYSNKVLRYINQFLANRKRHPIIVLLLLLPIFFIITMILTLFGQDADSIVKVFTDTTTWRFSQQVHPPVIESPNLRGHYLCTVAACGDPKVVKPLRLGKRGGQPIIVNRQLLIANAFESLLEDYTPALHRFVRTRYDKYGYNLSKKINTPALSNLTYILMKPLEWFFLLCLYLFCNKPEERIGRQYAG